MKWLTIVAVALFLGACGMSQEERQAYYEAQCRQLGWQENTVQFRDCVMVQEYRARIRAQQMYAIMMQNSTQSTGQSLMNLGTPGRIERVAPARVPYYGSLPSQ